MKTRSKSTVKVELPDTSSLGKQFQEFKELVVDYIVLRSNNNQKYRMQREPHHDDVMKEKEYLNRIIEICGEEVAA